MEVLVFIPLGIIWGYIMYKIKSEFWGYLFGIFPYLTFFLLSIDNREIWGHYRAIALLATLVASLTCFIFRRINTKKNGNLKSSS